MQSCRPATGASSGAARVISNVSQHNGGLENNFGGTETFLTNHFMVINSKCFCGDRLTSVCLDISDVRVCAAHLVPACSAHWRMNPFCLPQLRFVEVSGTAARVFKAAGLAADCK